jgi:hypothetical protein
LWHVRRLHMTHARPMLLSVDRMLLARSLIFGVLEFKGCYWPCSRTVGTQQTSCVLSSFLRKILLGCWISWTKGFVIDCLTDWEWS